MSDLAEALAFYRRVAASNRAFFQGKVDSLGRDTSLTDKQRLDKLAPYFGISKWGTQGHGSSTKSLQEVLILPGEPGYVELGINNDGTIPPASEQAQREYLEDLTI